ncbi:MAG: ribosome recycling factor [Bacteroidetes bacterium]|nr:ribosome recycling factor [Bacteroidota bacterium]
MSDIKTILESAKTQMEKTITHLESELAKIRAGKANPSMLDNVFVDYYGAKTTLGNVASVNTQDSRTILVQPWEKSMLTPIEKAIQAANLGFNPQNDGVLIRIIVPPLTEDGLFRCCLI